MRLLRTDPTRPDPEVIKTAAEVLKNGGIVAVPTETVYGLFTHAYREDGCVKVFKAKGRPMDNPLIVHVDSVEMASEIAEIPEGIRGVLAQLWPGPVTIVVKSRGVVPRCVTAGLNTVAVRAPAHPIPLAIIKELNAPIAGPSANKAGRPSPTTATHVLEDLGDEVDLIIDGGPTFFGVESTIIDVTRKPPALLRPGPFTVEELEKFFGEIQIPPVARGLAEAEVALAPGMKYKHYAPDTMLVIVHFDLAEAVKVLKARGLKVAVLCAAGKCADADASLHLGTDLYEVAKNLYKSLRDLDKLSVNIGIIPAVEERGIGLAIMNRIRKAAAHREAFSPEQLLKYI
ncbi:L-threonylcarbamoyladenylate synthase [Pyrobaculum aerophilum]|uniref:L-threonylcarbamoyladenylate synthase n=1 Tax=Pyrobaculum aerophilum TaxID=13773 RepID=UPI002FDA37F7